MSDELEWLVRLLLPSCLLFESTLEVDELAFSSFNERALRNLLRKMCLPP